jgi:hypothetical protein
MAERIIQLLYRNLREVFGEGDAARRRAAIDEFYTDDCVLYVPPGARPTRILYTRLLERPKLFTTLEFSPGARVREAELPITPGWTSSLCATEGLLRYTFSSIRNSRSSARYEPASNPRSHGSLLYRRTSAGSVRSEGHRRAVSPRKLIPRFTGFLSCVEWLGTLRMDALLSATPIVLESGMRL